MKKLFLPAFALFLWAAQPSTSLAQTAKEHPIDAEITACFNKSPSTLGVIECHLMGYRKWNDEADRIYNVLMGKLADEESKLVLKEQQAQWIKLRDLQFEFNNKFYEIYKGPGSITLIASSKTDYVRRRALELQSYIDELAGQ